MPYIRVKPATILDASEDIARIKDKVDRIDEKFMAAYRKIDWEVINKENISSDTSKINWKLQDYSSSLNAMASFLDRAYDQYIDVSGLEPEEKLKREAEKANKNNKADKKTTFFDGVKEGWNNFTEKVEETAEEIKEGVEEVAEDIKEGFEDFVDGVEDAVDYVIDETIHVTKEVWDWVNEVADKYKVPLKTVYQLYQVFQSYKIPVGALSALDSSFKIFGFSNVVLYIMDNYPSNEDHFNRNEHMKNRPMPKTPEEAEKMGWNNKVAANCHQFSAPNKDNTKWVSPDGTCEVIFDKDGDVVTDTRDYGTYNYADPENDPLGHLVKDVLPWIVNGNTPGENTTWEERMAIMMNKG